jgi:hypothetical protein
LLDEVKLIKTTELDESNAAYTRKDCIYIPISMIRWSYNELKELIAHELFHIISNYNPKFRNDLYLRLGFNPCSEVVVPKKYERLYITFPTP